MLEQQNKPNESKPNFRFDPFAKLKEMDIKDAILKRAYNNKKEEEERRKAEIEKQAQLEKEEKDRIANAFIAKSNAVDAINAEMAHTYNDADQSDDSFSNGLPDEHLNTGSYEDSFNVEEISEEEFNRIKAEAKTEHNEDLTLNSTEKKNDAALINQLKQSTHKPVVKPVDFDFTAEENSTNNQEIKTEPQNKDGNEVTTEQQTKALAEESISNAKSLADTGFEYLNTPEYRKTHRTVKDDGADIQLEDEREQKAELLRRKQAAEEKEKNKKEHKPQPFFRNDDLFSGKNSFINAFNNGTKFIPINFENLANLLLSGVLIYGLVRWLNYFFEIENVISVIYFLMITLAVGHFLPKLFNLKSQNKSLDYLMSDIIYTPSKDAVIILFMLVGFGVTYFLPLNYFDFVTKWTVIPLFISLVCMVLYITRWHLIASIVGIIIISLTMLSKVTIIDWDNEHLELETVRIGVKHIRANRVFSNIELVPSAVEIDTTGKYYVSTVNDGFTGSNYTIRDIPIYYTFKVSVKPTKSLLISMKLAKCYEDGGDYCDKFVEYYEQGQKNNPQGLTVMPLFYKPQLAEKPIYITSFKDYKMLAKLHLERMIFDLMQQNLTQIKLPLKEADYRFIIPRKLEMLLHSNNVLLPIGNPEIKLALHQISQLTLDVNQLKKAVK